MRVPIAIAVSAAGLVAGIVAAAAADLPPGYFAIGGPAPPLVIYDYEPGVVVRAYWLPPWDDRHYFPATGRRPRIGRAENFHTARPQPKPAHSFERYWSISSFVPAWPHQPLPQLK